MNKIDKEKALKIFLIGAIPAMMLIWAKNFGCFSKKAPDFKNQASPVAAVPGAVQAPVAGGEVLGKREERHTKYTTWGRPPFRVGEVLQAVAPLTLEGIVMDPLVPTAIINGEIKKEGDEIAGATVVLIQKTKVVLKKDKEEIVLEFFQQ